MTPDTATPPPVPPHQRKTPWLRIACVAAPPLLLTLWLSIPLLQPARQTASGTAERTRVCLVLCADVLKVGDTTLSCRADFLGTPYDCREKLLQPGAAVAQYAALPSLAALLGLAPTQGTLLRLQRDGVTVYSRSVAQQVWAALYGGWVFNAIYWPLMGLVIWRWPHSRLARRVTWKDDAG
jgi:hypothetical protein